MLLWVALITYIFCAAIRNDEVASYFGLSVAGKMLTRWLACLITTIFEMAGTYLLGYKIADTMRYSLFDWSLLENDTLVLGHSCMAAMVSGSSWLWIAAALKLPVSGTHTIVGAIVGIILLFSTQGIYAMPWETLSITGLSWIGLPVISGTSSVALYWLMNNYILKNFTPLDTGPNAMPCFYGLTLALRVINIVRNGTKSKLLNKFISWLELFILISMGVVAGAWTRLWLIPHLIKLLTRVTGPVNMPPEMSHEMHPPNTPTHYNESVPQQLTSLATEEGNDSNLEANDEGASMGALSASNKSSLNTKEVQKLAPLAIMEDIVSMEDISIVSKSITPPHKPLYEVVSSDIQINASLNKEISDCKSFDSANLEVSEGSFCSAISKVGDSTCEELERLEAVNAVLAMQHVTPPSRVNENVNQPVLSINCEPLQSEAITQDVLPVAALNPQDVISQQKKQILFYILQFFTAIFGAFAYGANDITIVIAPLAALWHKYTIDEAQVVNEALLAIITFVGIAIALWLWLWSRRLMQTVGENLARITLVQSLATELGTAMTVLIVSKMGLPVSTTHYKIVAIVCVGYYSNSNVNWRLFRNIVGAWVATEPVVAIMTACLTTLLIKIFG